MFLFFPVLVLVGRFSWLPIGFVAYVKYLISYHVVCSCVDNLLRVKWTWVKLLLVFVIDFLILLLSSFSWLWMAYSVLMCRWESTPSLCHVVMLTDVVVRLQIACVSYVMSSLSKPASLRLCSRYPACWMMLPVTAKNCQRTLDPARRMLQFCWPCHRCALLRVNTVAVC